MNSHIEYRLLLNWSFLYEEKEMLYLSWWVCELINSKNNIRWFNPSNTFQISISTSGRASTLFHFSLKFDSCHTFKISIGKIGIVQQRIWRKDHFDIWWRRKKSVELNCMTTLIKLMRNKIPFIFFNLKWM